jgi:hypothetical protein
MELLGRCHLFFSGQSIIDPGSTFLYPTCCQVRNIHLIFRCKQAPNQRPHIFLSQCNNLDAIIYTMAYVLGGFICRRRLRPLLQVYAKQYSAHWQGEQQTNLQAQAHVPIF